MENNIKTVAQATRAERNKSYDNANKNDSEYKEKRARYKRDYYDNHREEKRIRDIEYYNNHKNDPDYINKRKEYEEKNDNKKERNKTYRNKHREELNIKARKYREIIKN